MSRKARNPCVWKFFREMSLSSVRIPLSLNATRRSSHSFTKSRWGGFTGGFVHLDLKGIKPSLKSIFLVRNSHQKGSRKFVSDITFHKVADQVLTEPKTISMVHEDTILGSNRFLPPDLPHGPVWWFALLRIINSFGDRSNSLLRIHERPPWMRSWRKGSKRLQRLTEPYAPIVQPDRATEYEPERRGFSQSIDRSGNPFFIDCLASF